MESCQDIPEIFFASGSCSVAAEQLTEKYAMQEEYSDNPAENPDSKQEDSVQADKVVKPKTVRQYIPERKKTSCY